MDEELPLVEPLSYADDVPYESQLPELLEDESTSLKKRIGNRIYLLEDSMSKKRKLADVEDNVNEHGDEVGEEDADLPHRPNALLLQGPPITQIPTARVFAYATHFDAHPIGLEWVDDQTCVLVFTSRKNAMQAWNALRKMSQPTNTTLEDAMAIEAEDIDEGFHPAHPLPLALYPIEERINSVLGNKKSNALKEAIQIRWARSTDVKERGARVKSEFYKRHGAAAGKEGLPGFSGTRGVDEAENGSKRRKRNDEEETKRQLDAELDVFLVEDESSSSNSLGVRVTEEQNRKSRQSEDRSLIQEEKRRILDDELDSFLAGGGATDSSLEPAEPTQESNSMPRRPSLLERTERTGRSKSQTPQDRSRQTKPLPRRGRRRGQDEFAPRYETDADGRWLHNAEISQRMRGDGPDTDGFGMRAWSSEQPRRPKPRKTQEELDRELDQFWKQTD